MPRDIILPPDVAAPLEWTLAERLVPKARLSLRWVVRVHVTLEALLVGETLVSKLAVRLDPHAMLAAFWPDMRTVMLPVKTCVRSKGAVRL
jgi:hypothetical protein